MHNTLGRGRSHWRRQGGRISFLALTGNLGLLVVVLRIAGGATRQPDGVPDHHDDRVIGQSTLTRTVVIQNVTKPRLALLHLFELPMNSRWREEVRAKGEVILAELLSEWQEVLKPRLHFVKSDLDGGWRRRLRCPLGRH